MADNEKANWDYKSEKTDSPRGAKTVSWTASEYIDHHRGFTWYLLLLIATAAISALTYLMTRDSIPTGTIILVGIIVGLFARQKPREITYELNGAGLKIGDKFYAFSLFKSFSVITDGALKSISFSPLKRFMPPLSAYYAPNDEQKIINSLSQHLPYEEGSLDMVDRLSRRLRL